MSVNAHTHLYSGLVPLGMPAPDREPRNFPEILERVWWRLDRALDERSLHAAALYYLTEATAMGTTAIVDHHESPNFIEGSLDVLADACEQTGMRAVLCYGATERNGGVEEARRGLRECRRFVLSNRSSRVRGAVGLHAAFTVSDETIREAVDLCQDLGAPLHVHVAEDRVDATGFSRLLEIGALIPGSIFAHGVHLTRQQVQLCDAAGIWIVQNPRSNRANRVGYPPYLTSTRYVALGTDGFPSDLDVEAAALRQHGETDDEVARRRAGGEKLIDSLLQPPAPVLTRLRGEDAAPAGGPSAGSGTASAVAEMPALRREAIVETATREAKRLWERMKCID